VVNTKKGKQIDIEGLNKWTPTIDDVEKVTLPKKKQNMYMQMHKYTAI